jgi:predicted short-subunit dehydrogenase-like oxidoreductase (DUF2520 family)
MTIRTLPAIAVLGPGRLGRALAAALTARGYRVRLASSRVVQEAQDAVDASDIVFITVPDGAIGGVAAVIDWRPGHAVVHCSGARSLEVLTVPEQSGALIGCLHPLQSFPADADPDTTRFEGITCGIEGAPPLDAILASIAADLGARTVRLEGFDRALYHAAAVLISNNAVALAAAATRAWTLAGLPESAARQALAPLLLGAAANIAAHPLVEALTGPIARGDIGTIERHLAALERDPDLHALYRALAAELLRLPLDHADAVSARLRALLDTPPPQA